MINQLISITKSDGTKQLFEEEKLINSLKKVGASPEVIDDIVDDVEREMKDGMQTTDIYNRAFELLKKHSHHIAVKYSIRRALFELGPDGFPFERFVARIFRMWGYETLTDQNVKGTCVEHEVDVVAWKDTKLAMVEAKFHNEFGIKSDLKVALYVKARFDDIAGIEYSYGGAKMKLSDKYLFTNTKFTDKAVTYAGCNSLKLVGWNYPDSGNLHELIEENGLHPITCITSLSNQQKKDLIGRDVLVCVDVIGRPEVLKEIGVPEADREKMLTEVQVIVEEGK